MAACYVHFWTNRNTHRRFPRRKEGDDLHRRRVCYQLHNRYRFQLRARFYRRRRFTGSALYRVADMDGFIPRLDFRGDSLGDCQQSRKKKE